MINEEEAQRQLANLSEEDLEQRIIDLELSRRAAMRPLEGIERPASRDAITSRRTSSIPEVALDQNVKAKRCPNCKMDNAEIARVCSACDEPLGRIIVP